MSQYTIEGNTVILKVRKANFALRATLFMLAFLFFVSPIMGIVGAISSGASFHIGFLIGMGIFSLLGFYLLRLALWNTFGTEPFLFSPKSVQYEADYGWFKDGKKIISFETLSFSTLIAGYEDENKAIFVLSNGSEEIMGALKIPMPELQVLVNRLTATQKQ